MSTRKIIPKDVPDEVKVVLSHLRQETPSLTEERERLVAELEALAASSQGTLQQLLLRMRGVLLTTKAGAPLEPRSAREFARALESYRKDPSGPKPPPGLITECLLYLRDLVEATGLGPLLDAVDEINEAASPPPTAEQGKEQQSLQMRITLSNTRG